MLSSSKCDDVILFTTKLSQNQTWEGTAAVRLRPSKALPTSETTSERFPHASGVSPSFGGDSSLRPSSSGSAPKWA